MKRDMIVVRVTPELKAKYKKVVENPDGLNTDMTKHIRKFINETIKKEE